jgi:tetratricopeptide (TPR) repeat protein
MIRLTVLALMFSLVAPLGLKADQDDAMLDALFARLQATADADEATTIEQSIWTTWIHHKNGEIGKRMSIGINAMNRGAYKLSILAFGETVEIDPGYAEGWNKRATAYYLLGDYEASVIDIQKTLALEPRHFGALSGLGLIYSAIGKDRAALKAWEKALTINPQMPGIKARVKELRQKVEGQRT